MKKFVKELRGAVAIFLAIIVVPLITITSIFVDTSKTVLAHSVAESAADLTLNTVLTNYDTKLNEYFGLLASCQSMDEAYQTAGQFFVDCMTSQAVEAENQSGLGYQLSKIGASKNKTDFLGLKVTDGGVKISAMDNGSLANPAIMKKQIVEFNKYRAPVNTAIDIINWFNNSKKRIEDLDDITQMTDDKNKFYEEESDLVDSLKKLRDRLIEYDNVGVKQSFITETQNKMKSGGEIDQFYASLHKKIIYDYLNVFDNNGKAPNSHWNYTIPNTKSNSYPQKTITVTNEDGTTQKQSVPDIEKAINACAKACADYKNAETSYLNLLYNIGVVDINGNDIYESKKSSINDVQYWAIVENNLGGNSNKTEDLLYKYDNMNVAYQQLENCLKAYNSLSVDIQAEHYDGSCMLHAYSYKNLKGSTVYVGAYNQTKSYDSHKNDLQNFINNAKTSNGIEECKKLKDRMNNIYGNIISKSDSYEQNGGISTDAATQKIAAIAKDLNDRKTKLKKASDAIKSCLEVIQGKGPIKISLASKLDKYNSAFSTWETSVNGLSDSNEQIVINDRNEIATKKGKGGNGKDADANDVLLTKVTKADITALENRLKNVKALLDGYIKAIDEVKYSGVSVVNMSNAFDAVKAFKNTAKKESRKTDTFYKSDLDKLQSVKSITLPDSSTFNVTNNNNPDLSVNEPVLRGRLYRFFKEKENQAQYSEYSESSAKDAKNKFKKKSEQEGSSDNATSTNASKNEISKVENLPSKGTTSKESENSKSSKLSDITSKVSSMFSSLGENVRDDLLVTDYVMRMFSYDTFEEELLMSCAADADDAPKNKSDWSSKRETYTKELNNNKTLSYWGYNKNLRNIPIDTSTCYSYLNEVEYILYGGTNSSNKTTAACLIYAIRFACDLLPVIQEYWDNTALNGIATSISAATYGVLPVSLIKLLICLGLTCVEAGIDLSYIKAGFGIKFFKGSSEKGPDLFCSFSDGDISDGESADGANGVGFGVSKGYFQYSDYLEFFLLLKTMTSKGESDVLKRIGDVVHVNMGLHEKGYNLTKSQVYFNLNADVSVKPLLLSQPINASEYNPFTKAAEIVKFNYSMMRGY